MIPVMELSGAIGQFSGALDNSSFGSCSSSLALDTDVAMSASSRMAQDANDAMSEASWPALAKEKERDWGEMKWAAGQLRRCLQKKNVKGRE